MLITLSISHLIAALAGLDHDNLPHVVGLLLLPDQAQRFLVSGRSTILASHRLAEANNRYCVL